MKLYFVLILIMIFPIVLSAHDGDDRDDKDDHKREKIIISSQVIHSINSNYQKDIKPIFRITLFSNIVKIILLGSMIFFTLNVTNAIIVFFLIPSLLILILSIIHLLNNYHFRINFNEMNN